MSLFQIQICSANLKMIIILLFLKFQFLEAQKDGGNFQDLVHTLGLERLGIGQWTLQDWSGSEISKIAAELVGCP